jgi:hypothetical protein
MNVKFITDSHVWYVPEVLKESNYLQWPFQLAGCLYEHRACPWWGEPVSLSAMWYDENIAEPFLERLHVQIITITVGLEHCTFFVAKIPIYIKIK